MVAHGSSAISQESKAILTTYSAQCQCQVALGLFRMDDIVGKTDEAGQVNKVIEPSWN